MAIVKTPAAYQVTAAKIASRARKDKAFNRQLVGDPIKTLNRLRIGSDAVRELINEDGFARSKFGALSAGDCTVTCICTSGCCVTCWLGTSSRVSAADLVSNPAKAVFGAPDPSLRVSRERAKLVDNLITSGHIKSPTR